MPRIVSAISSLVAPSLIACSQQPANRKRLTVICILCDYFSLFDMAKPKRPAWFTPPASDFDFGPPDFSGVSSSDPPLEEACEILAAILDWLFKTIEKIVQAIWDIIKSIASGLTLPVRATGIDDLPGSQSWLIKQFQSIFPNAISIDPCAYVVEFRRPSRDRSILGEP